MEWDSLVDGGYLFDKLQSVDLNGYISIQDGIIVIIVLNFLCSGPVTNCKEREFGTER